MQFVNKIGFLQQLCQQTFQHCFQFLQSDPMKNTEFIDANEHQNDLQTQNFRELESIKSNSEESQSLTQKDEPRNQPSVNDTLKLEQKKIMVGKLSEDQIQKQLNAIPIIEDDIDYFQDMTQNTYKTDILKFPLTQNKQDSSEKSVKQHELLLEDNEDKQEQHEWQIDDEIQL